MHWNDPAILASLISAVGSVVAALIAALIAVIVGRQLSERRRLVDHINTATDDIAFLLHVEKELSSKETTEAKSAWAVKMEARNKAREAGLTWSGKYTPGRARHRRLPD